MSLPMPPDPYRLNGYHPIPSPELPVANERRIPPIHIVLFAATLLTTSLAGTFQAGVNPFDEPDKIVLGLPFALTAMSILLAHEMGHYFLARFHGIRASLPYFLPAPPNFILFGTFGAFIRMRSMPANRRALFDVGAAGPWAGAVIAVVAAAVGLALSEIRPLNPFNESGLILGDSFLFSALSRVILGVSSHDVSIVLHPIALAGWFGLFVTFLNLLPVGQLDGGHVAYSLFGRFHWWISRAVLLLILLLGFHHWIGWIFWVVLLLTLGVDHPPTADWTAPLDPRRRLYAWGTVALFALTFMPIPISLPDQLEVPAGEVTHISAVQPLPAQARSFLFVYHP